MTPRRCKVLALVLVTALAATVAARAGDALETASPWEPGANSRARLVAAGGLQNHHYQAGLEIELKGGAHTYWRQPGDAGVPPVLSTEGSVNVKSAELSFPAPERIDEGGLQVFGYQRPILLPLRIEPVAAGEPVRLKVHFSYAACEKICIPAEARATLDLLPGAALGPHAPRLAAAIEALPAKVPNGTDIKLTARPLAGDKTAWTVAVERPAGPWRDMFVEGPDGWFFETKATEGGFTVTADEMPKAATWPVSVVVTLAGKRDLETRIDLSRP